MKSKTIILGLLLFVSVNSFSQKFYLGEELYPNTKSYKFLGKSSETYVATYKYIGAITDKYYYGRKIGEIIVGIKNNRIVTTIYNVIPEPSDVGVPSTILELIENNLPYPLTYRDGVYGVSIDQMNFTISRTKNALTFHQDRIMFFTSVRNRLLKE
jgi:hypothetical protein